MDYMKFVEAHRASNADISIGCLPVDHTRASDFGLMKIDGKGRIVDFAEKPQGEALEAMAVDTTVLGLDAATAAANPFIASMGIYVFRKDVMIKLLKDDPSRNDFGGEIIPQSAKDNKVCCVGCCGLQQGGGRGVEDAGCKNAGGWSGRREGCRA